MNGWNTSLWFYFPKTQISIVEEWVLFIFSVNWWKLIFYFVQWNRKRTNFPYVLHSILTKPLFLKHKHLTKKRHVKYMKIQSCYSTYKFNTIKRVKVKSYFVFCFISTVCNVQNKKWVETYFCIMILYDKHIYFPIHKNHLEKQK